MLVEKLNFLPHTSTNNSTLHEIDTRSAIFIDIEEKSFTIRNQGSRLTKNIPDNCKTHRWFIALVFVNIIYLRARAMKRRAPDKSSYFVSSLVHVYRTGYGLVACDWSQFIRLARRLGASGSHESARVNDHHLRGIARLLVFVIHPLTSSFVREPASGCALRLNYFSLSLREIGLSNE